MDGQINRKVGEAISEALDRAVTLIDDYADYDGYTDEQLTLNDFLHGVVDDLLFIKQQIEERTEK